ncbi:hypothetical protein ADU37_CDS22760 [Thermococcus sp. 2319x1]|nr:hypothetical protein ADU37_CDS22760 [Thermococcus sp. 2319x1]
MINASFLPPLTDNHILTPEPDHLLAETKGENKKIRITKRRIFLNMPFT